MVKSVIAVWSVALAMAVGAMPRVGAQAPAADVPALQADGTVGFPDNYREWMFLSAGLGMNYGPNAPAPGQPQSFTKF